MYISYKFDNSKLFKKDQVFKRTFYNKRLFKTNKKRTFKNKSNKKLRFKRINLTLNLNKLDLNKAIILNNSNAKIIRTFYKCKNFLYIYDNDYKNINNLMFVYNHSLN